MSAESALHTAKRVWKFLLVVLVLFLIGWLAGEVSSEASYEQPIRGRSMLPCLSDGESVRMLVKGARELARGDIVVFAAHEKYKDDESAYYIKRIIGLPGEQIALAKGFIYINGELLIEEYLSRIGATMSDKWLGECSTITLSQDQYFLMGDNREMSRDSRALGPTNSSDITAVLPVDRQQGQKGKWVIQDSDYNGVPARFDLTACSDHP
jgi:signal peptidase I